jgi:predicted nucleic acid-binding protein
MILLDTDVISEPYRRVPSTVVREWFDAQAPESLFLCAPVLAELHAGVEQLPAGARRNRLAEWIRNLESNVFANRILPFEHGAARDFARIVAARKRAGRPIGSMDAIIAAIAASHGATIVTRDTAAFEGIGIPVINPFDAR